MSVEIYSRLPDDDKEYGNFLVEPGDGNFVWSYLDDKVQAIGIACDLLDDEGMVCVYPPEEGFADPTAVYVEPEELPVPTEKVSIDEDNPHEHLILTEDGEMFFLGSRLVSSHEITRSGLIPLGLIYPDLRVPFKKDT